ncbi:competence protein CoiA family protein [Streptomyces sp. NPDC051992]|uniref:competence protein CoiA family protein n=1 Tax=Streptomyces sp. NPDC051992 TaxID=3161012 RepID=UPI00341DC7D4
MEELEAFRRTHENDTIWCGTKFEGGCGRRLTTRLCTDKICHFAHYASSGSGERCGRKAKGKDSADHLFAKAHLAAWLHTQGLTAEFSYPEPLGSAVLVHLENGRILLVHLDRNRPVSRDNSSWEVILGPGVRIAPDILEQRGYVQRIRFEDRPGGGRVMRLGTEHPRVGTTWDGLEDVELTSRGLNTSTRPDAVRAPMATGLRHSESGGALDRQCRAFPAAGGERRTSGRPGQTRGDASRSRHA